MHIIYDDLCGFLRALKNNNFLSTTNTISSSSFPAPTHYQTLAPSTGACPGGGAQGPGPPPPPRN